MEDGVEEVCLDSAGGDLDAGRAEKGAGPLVCFSRQKL
jgi:hypothetical protein